MEEEREQAVIRISVRDLVEFVMREGDIDNRRTAGAKREAMQAGSRLHRKLQRGMGASYRAEVSLKHYVEEGPFRLLVEGRADGIFKEPAGQVVDEIKCVYADLERFEEPAGVHLAQARCYAWFYAADTGAEAMGVQVTYCNIETEALRRFRYDYSRAELEEWFSGLVHEYVKWARYQYHHGLRRSQSLKELAFPYPYREGQKALAAAVYRAVSQGRDLFIQAPTGVGKTLSTVFPSLKAMGEGMGDKLFYLTAKTITRSVAQEAFSVLRAGGGLCFKTVVITAKEKLCLLEKPDCNPAACPAAKGHFDRVNDAVYEILCSEDDITREKILDYAGRFQVCPFEFCLDISNWVDGIICDYNYVFDPNVRLKRYFGEGATAMEYLFLVDEAHNLVPRAREMYSARLVKEEVLLAKRILKNQPGAVKAVGKLERCNRELLRLKRETDPEGLRQVHGREYRLLPDVKLLALEVMSMFGELERFMNDHPEFEDRDLVLDFYFKARDFLYACERMDHSYRAYSSLEPDGSFMVKIMCINPADSLKECTRRGRSTVFFSATLLPIQYYKKLLRGEEDCWAVYANSPFPKGNRLLLTAGDVSSLYRRRGPREYEKAAGYIRDIVSGRSGNYMVFCPSYRYMEELEQVFQGWEAQGPLPFCRLVQSSRMSEQEREEFLKEFDKEGEGTLVALCVMGGIFSEGHRLKGGAADRSRDHWHRPSPGKCGTGDFEGIF